MVRVSEEYDKVCYEHWNVKLVYMVEYHKFSYMYEDWKCCVVVVYYFKSKAKNFMRCVMELALQLTHNSRLSIGYQTVTNAHKNKGLKGSNSLLWTAHLLNCQNHNSSSPGNPVVKSIMWNKLI